jgi:hypothetical protein
MNNLPDAAKPLGHPKQYSGEPRAPHGEARARGLSPPRWSTTTTVVTKATTPLSSSPPRTASIISIATPASGTWGPRGISIYLWALRRYIPIPVWLCRGAGVGISGPVRGATRVASSLKALARTFRSSAFIGERSPCRSIIKTSTTALSLRPFTTGLFTEPAFTPRRASRLEPSTPRRPLAALPPGMTGRSGLPGRACPPTPAAVTATFKGIALPFFHQPYHSFPK